MGHIRSRLCSDRREHDFLRIPKKSEPTAVARTLGESTKAVGGPKLWRRMSKEHCARAFRRSTTSGTLGALSDGELLDLFTDRRDETAELAFATLVERHGAMVLRVCRSLLRDEHDAQDAFQATFLILVRRAGAIRKRESVGSWLYGVSLRVSACAEIAAARRRRHERLAAKTVSNRLADEADSRELSAIIHEELRRLPERYRCGRRSLLPGGSDM